MAKSNEHTNDSKIIKEMDDYYEFLIWAVSKLNDIKFCCSFWNDSKWTPGNKDISFPKIPYNYFYHEFQNYGKNEIANFFYNKRFGINPEEQLIDLYDKPIVSKMLYFRILEIDFKKMHETKPEKWKYIKWNKLNNIEKSLYVDKIEIIIVENYCS